MTGARQPRRPPSATIARVVRLTAAAGTLAILVTVARAQGWDATVLTGAAPPKAAVKPQPKQALPKPKASAPFAVVIEKEIKPALMDEVSKPAPAKAAALQVPPATARLETGSIKGPRADDYCTNVADQATDARFAWQKKTLADMEQEILKRIALLEERTAEYQKWLARRDEFSQKANETLLRIYARMRPDAAAAQLAALDEETAASVITKLDARIASLILNEMDATQAVRLTATISGSGKINPAPKPALEAKAK